MVLIRFYGNLVPFHVEQIRVGLEWVVASRVSECLLLSDLSQLEEVEPFWGVLHVTLRRLLCIFVHEDIP